MDISTGLDTGNLLEYIKENAFIFNYRPAHEVDNIIDTLQVTILGLAGVPGYKMDSKIVNVTMDIRKEADEIYAEIKAAQETSSIVASSTNKRAVACACLMHLIDFANKNTPMPSAIISRLAGVHEIVDYSPDFYPQAVLNAAAVAEIEKEAEEAAELQAIADAAAAASYHSHDDYLVIEGPDGQSEYDRKKDMPSNESILDW